MHLSCASEVPESVACGEVTYAVRSHRRPPPGLYRNLQHRPHPSIAKRLYRVPVRLASSFVVRPVAVLTTPTLPNCKAAPIASRHGTYRNTATESDLQHWALCYQVHIRIPERRFICNPTAKDVIYVHNRPVRLQLSIFVKTDTTCHFKTDTHSSRKRTPMLISRRPGILQDGQVLSKTDTPFIAFDSRC